jgi:GT2 family glycosyltransferase
VDDASTDDSSVFLNKRFPDVKVVRNETNVGFAESINRGVQESQTDWVAFLNNDTRVDPEWLLALVRVTDVHSRVVCAASKTLDWDGKRITFQGGYLNFAGKGFEAACFAESPEEIRNPKELLFASGCGMLVHRQTFLDVGGFDKQFFGFYEDTDFGWRLNLMGLRVMLAPDSKVYHRGHVSFDAVGRKRRLALLERNALWQIFKNYGEETLEPVLCASLLLAIKRSEILGRYGGRRVSGFYGESLPSLGKRLLGKRLRGLTRPAPYADEGGEITEAVTGFLNGLDEMAQKRKEIQGRRCVPDPQILRSSFFPDPYRPWGFDVSMLETLDRGGYRDAIREVVRTFGVDRFFSGAP